MGPAQTGWDRWGQGMLSQEDGGEMDGQFFFLSIFY